uniref:Calcitonin n=1 Tax=Spermophilus dauricus TaxID=99837 RepID=A0A8C9PWE4_SPEDA
MGFQKFFPILALSILVLYQAGSLHALYSPPASPGIKHILVFFYCGMSYPPACISFPPHGSPVWSNLLLTAHGGCPWCMVLSGMSFPCSLDSPRSKRCGNLSTCMLGTYTQDLNKFHTFPQTAIGVGAPGKKRDMNSDLETEYRPHVGMLQDAI